MRGLDPRIHLFRKKMDGRVEPGHDAVVCGYFAGVIRTCTSRGFAVYGAEVTSTWAPASA